MHHFPPQTVSAGESQVLYEEYPYNSNNSISYYENGTITMHNNARRLLDEKIDVINKFNREAVTTVQYISKNGTRYYKYDIYDPFLKKYK